MPRITRRLNRVIDDDFWEDFLEAFERNKALIALTCKEMHIANARYYDKYRSDPDFKARVDDITALQVNKVENKMFEMIDKGDHMMISLYLKAKGGYKEETITTIKNDNFKLDIGDCE